jgi:hypothetical protein
VRRPILLGTILVLSLCAWTAWHERSSAAPPKQFLAPTIVKQPVRFATRTFDPANPPADMPPLTGAGEVAQCVSDFSAQANVGGEAQRPDGTHAVLTVNQITVTLQLSITIWAPAGASDRVMEHEEGHRQISEYYYRSADKLAAGIAASYMGKQVTVTGADVNAEFHKALRDVGAQITEEYDKQLNPNPTQLLYDTITDHARNDVAVQEAVDHALKNVSVEYDQSAKADPEGQR